MNTNTRTPDDRLRLASGEWTESRSGKLAKQRKPPEYDIGQGRRVYVAGPMRNIPEHNFPTFDACRDALKELGYIAISPPDITRHLFDGDQSKSPREYLRTDLMHLVTCEAICFLPGWECSTGAKLEAAVAMTLGMMPLCFYPHDQTNVETNGRPDAFVAVYAYPESIVVVDGYRDDPRLTPR